MDMHPTSEQIDDCIESLQLLYSCPVVHMLRFKDIIKYSFQCQQPHLAAALLPFLNDDDKKYVLEVTILYLHYNLWKYVIFIAINNSFTENSRCSQCYKNFRRYG